MAGFKQHRAHLFASGTRAACGTEASAHDRMYLTDAFRTFSGENATGAVCKRCLASLAKRDREFRAKARRTLVEGLPWPAAMIGRAEDGGWLIALPGEQEVRLSFHPRVAAARAIAREEGQHLSAGLPEMPREAFHDFTRHIERWRNVRYSRYEILAEEPGVQYQGQTWRDAETGAVLARMVSRVEDACSVAVLRFAREEGRL